jgi:hypothetical protein
MRHEHIFVHVLLVYADVNLLGENINIKKEKHRSCITW